MVKLRSSQDAELWSSRAETSWLFLMGDNRRNKMKTSRRRKKEQDWPSGVLVHAGRAPVMMSKNKTLLVSLLWDAMLVLKMIKVHRETNRKTPNRKMCLSDKSSTQFFFFWFQVKKAPVFFWTIIYRWCISPFIRFYTILLASNLMYLFSE